RRRLFASRRALSMPLTWSLPSLELASTRGPGSAHRRSRAVPFAGEHRLDVLVASPGEVQDDEAVRRELAPHGEKGRDRVGGLERGEDPLSPGEQAERRDGRPVLDRD